MDKLSGVVALLTLTLLAYILVALWLSRRQDMREEHARRLSRARQRADTTVMTRTLVERTRVRRDEHDPA